MPKREALKREPSTGNVFADLGVADAGEHLVSFCRETYNLLIPYRLMVLSRLRIVQPE
jgi:hypothetical protein